MLVGLLLLAALAAAAGDVAESLEAAGLKMALPKSVASTRTTAPATTTASTRQEEKLAAMQAPRVKSLHTAKKKAPVKQARQESDDRERLSVDAVEEGKEYEEEDWLKIQVLKRLEERRMATASVSNATSAPAATAKATGIWGELKYPDLWDLLRDRQDDSLPRGEKTKSVPFESGLLSAVNATDAASFSTVLMFGDSDGRAAGSLAESFPADATIVTMVREESELKKHRKRARRDRVVFGVGDVTEERVDKLLSSVFWAQYVVVLDMSHLLQNTVRVEAEALLTKLAQLGQHLVMRFSLKDGSLKVWQNDPIVLLKAVMERGAFKHSFYQAFGHGFYRLTVRATTRSVFAREGEKTPSWKLVFKSAWTRVLPTRFPVLVENASGAAVPVDVFGVSLSVLRLLGVSHFSRRRLFERYSAEVPNRFIALRKPAAAVTTQMASAPLSKMAIRRFGALQKIAASYAVPISAALSIGAGDVWLCGSQLVFDPTISAFARLEAALPKSENAPEAARPRRGAIALDLPPSPSPGSRKLLSFKVPEEDVPEKEAESSLLRRIRRQQEMRKIAERAKKGDTAEKKDAAEQAAKDELLTPSMRRKLRLASLKEFEPFQQGRKNTFERSSAFAGLGRRKMRIQDEATTTESTEVATTESTAEAETEAPSTKSEEEETDKTEERVSTEKPLRLRRMKRFMPRDTGADEVPEGESDISAGPLALLSVLGPSSQLGTELWDVMRDLLPDPNVPSDFSLLFHESGEGEMCLKVSKEFPGATVVSYSSTPEDAELHALSARAMGVENNIIGSLKHFAQTSSHDPIERVLRDIRSSLDLFDFQIITPHLFALLLHHSQSDFERMLGSSFAVARTTVITAPLCKTLQEGLALFGSGSSASRQLDLTCYNKKKMEHDLVMTLAEREAVQCAAGMILCAADAANVEVKLRLLRKLNLAANEREIVAEVTLVSMDRPVGGMFKYLEEEGPGPHEGAVEEKEEGSVAVNNYKLEFRRQGSGEEKLWISRKDGKKSLLWKSPLRGRGSTEYDGMEKGRGVSIYSLLAVNPVASLRRDLVQRYLRDADNILTPWRNVAHRAEPWCTYLYRSTLFYVWPFARDADGAPVHSGGNVDPKVDEFATRTTEKEQLELDLAAGMGLAADIGTLEERWFDSPMSYLEHGSSSGFTAAAIAKIFSKSSVLIVTNSTESRLQIERLLRRNGVKNGLVVLQRGMGEYGVDMGTSPEFFNFQYFNGFFGAWRKDPENFAGEFPEDSFSSLLTCAQVSYILMPHPRIFSLSLAVFHGPNPALRVYAAPKQGSKNRHMDHYAADSDEAVDPSILELYELAAHPNKTPLRDWDFDLIEARMDVVTRVQGMTMQRVPVPRARVGVSMRDLRHSPSGRWTLVRLMPTSLSRVVQHHFRAELDGHKRRYKLHHVQGSVAVAAAVKDVGDLASVWKKPVAGVGMTWLQRMDDGGSVVANSLIPYTHFGISLITLLRIGMSDATKERLYGMFLQIPVYQDMATWNIQWAQGKLAYVDVDTMQADLEVSLPQAYQAVLALMNYERTVSDFGKCERPLRMPFGIPYVGSCVKGLEEMRTDDRMRRDAGCTDALPVPCHGKCLPTFVHCLRDMYERQLMGESFNVTTTGEGIDGEDVLLLARKKREFKKKVKPSTGDMIKRLADLQ